MMNLPDGSQKTPAIQPAYSKAHEIVLVGVNHRTAAVEVREKLAFTPEETDKALTALRRLPFVYEVLLISTCNRVEVLAATDQPDKAEARIPENIADFKSVPHSRFKPSVYAYKGDDAVRHLFRVCSSLDSMVLGEPQILGQVKQAYRRAVDTKATGVVINRLLHKAFSIAKRIRTETGIGGHAVSISYAAIEMARKIFGSLEDKSVLLIGAGEMAELAVDHLSRSRRGGRVFVANRTFSSAVELAERFSGAPIRFDEIPETLKSVDIIVASTGSRDFVVGKTDVKPLMRKRKNRPLFFIDIAVPRNIDPEINRLPNTYLYDIDDLQEVVEENLKTRHQESAAAERIVEEGVLKFRNWYDSLDVVPTIVALREKLSSISEAELNKTIQSMDLSEDEQESLRKMTDAIVKKFLHEPTVFLKNPGSHRNKTAYIDFARKLFNLDEPH